MNKATRKQWNKADRLSVRAQCFWRQCGVVNFLLLPLAIIFVAAAAFRKLAYRLLPADSCGKPLIVVGGITVGGGGKTPVVIALAAALQQRGFRVGIVSRGYGGKYHGIAMATAANWLEVGDEAALIAKKSGCVVCVCRRRQRAAQRLAAACDVIISDDGLQHYAMHRDVEICVVNGGYQFGNALPLPAGPLRESRRRAAACDFVLAVGGTVRLPTATVYSVAREFDRFYALRMADTDLPAAAFRGKKIAAVAGIAHPDSFFATLEEQGVNLDQRIALADHGRLPDSVLRDIDADVILMSEKDAIKYPAPDARLHAAAIRCVLPDAFVAALAARLSALSAVRMR